MPSILCSDPQDWGCRMGSLSGALAIVSEAFMLTACFDPHVSGLTLPLDHPEQM